MADRATILVRMPPALKRRLVHEDDEGLVAVRLTEVEAYAGLRDPGSHAYRGPTPRTPRRGASASANHCRNARPAIR